VDSNRWWLPGWLYEALPYLYVGGGLVIAATFEVAWGVLAGLLLVAAGVVVWFVRRSARSAARNRPARPRNVPPSGSSPDEGKSYYNNYD
jgi:hypothetical protein